jgi:hypothetical protein
MRVWAWALLAAGGFGLMALAYDRWLRQDPNAPWAYGFLCIGNQEPARSLEAGVSFSTRLRYLPASTAIEETIKGIDKALPGRGPSLQARLRSKLIEMPVNEMGSLVGWLREGRMPEPGRGELLAGCQLHLDDEITVAGKTMKVVGVLEPGIALFSECYLAPASSELREVFAASDPSVQQVRIVRMSDAEFHDRQVQQQVAAAFPPKTFAILNPEARSSPRGYYTYLTGAGLFLMGGTGILIGIYRWLAAHVRWPFLAVPLSEIASRPRLLWGVHLAYFGLYIVGSLIIYHLPLLQTVLMAGVQGELSSEGKGVLAVAGKAYSSGNMLWAALVTFVINFFLGSLLMITVPSMIIPACGALLAGVRATLWGLLLGPSQVSLAKMMLPHIGTLLLEGAGYILATFFALLIPIYLFGPGRPNKPATPAEVDEPGDYDVRYKPVTAFHRFGDAVTLNFKGALLVAMVLAVAACYEAVEVITMAGF